MRYRHEHHAGNFADVHKHVLLLSCAAAMQRKDRGFVYAETHAGRGRYDLASPAARAGGEAERGVLRLQRHLADHPQLALAGGPLAEYVDAVAAWARGSGLRRGYPGSPVLVAGRLRSQDRAVLFEADARECALLERALAHCRRCRVAQQDGYRALRSLLPPAERRCLVLIDPPYEDAAADRERIVATLGDALARCATGLYLIWYPLKRAAEGVRWLRQLTAVCDSARPHSRPWLASELWVHPLDSPVALNGSGLLLVNPPFQIEREWRAATAALAAALADVGGGWRLVP